MSEPTLPEPAATRERGLRALVVRAREHLLQFFAEPVDGTSAAFFRVSLGALACWESLGIWLNLGRYYGPRALTPYSLVARDKFVAFTPFAWFPDNEAVPYVLATLFSLFSLAYLVGWKPRVFALLLAYLHLGFQFRQPFILNSGDRLFMIQLVLSAVAPLSLKFSVDAWRARRRGLSLEPGTIWGQRLLGLQIAYVYLNSASAKIVNERWQTGMAMRDVLASPVFSEWPTYIDARPLVMFLTYSALVYEFLFPFAVWWRRVRPFMLAWGVVFHASIDLLMTIPIFSAIMIVSLSSYLRDEEVRRVLSLFRRRRQAGVVAADAPTGEVEAAPITGRSEPDDPRPGS